MPDVTAAGLAAQVLKRSSHDYSDIWASTEAHVARPERHGVRVVVAPTSAFSDAALDALLAWRLGQYLLTGFYDPAVVSDRKMAGEPRDDLNADDVHALAIDKRGALLCYMTMKRVHAGRERRFRDEERSLLPCEAVHGRGWQEQLTTPDDVALASTWEFARFCKEQRSGTLDRASRRAPLELALVVARLSKHPVNHTLIRLIVGDFDPDVALRNLRYFFVPVATFPPHRVALPAGDPLAPRYRDHPTAPFAADPRDADEATYIRWVDIDLALSCDDNEASRRLKALRRFVSVRESSLKHPSGNVDPTPYPGAALTAASSRDAGAALWTAAGSGAIPWSARTLGPGEGIEPSLAVWVVDGYVQAFTGQRGGRAHLASLGPEVAFVPTGVKDDDVVAVEAATPARVLTTTPDHFEDFWARRQKTFETSTSSLYGDVALSH